MRKKEGISIRDISNISGYSIATVSRVIYVPEYNTTGISTYGLPVVYTFLLPPWETGENSCAVISDRRSGGYLATKALLDEVCRNIGIFYEQRWYAADAYLGYADALRERGLAMDPKNEIYTHALYTSRARDVTRELLKGDFPFDGLVATSPRITIGVLSALLESGRRIPDDIRLVGFVGIRARLRAAPAAPGARARGCHGQSGRGLAPGHDRRQGTGGKAAGVPGGVARHARLSPRSYSLMALSTMPCTKYFCRNRNARIIGRTAMSAVAAAAFRSMLVWVK